MSFQRTTSFRAPHLGNYGLISHPKRTSEVTFGSVRFFYSYSDIYISFLKLGRTEKALCYCKPPRL